MRPSADSRRRLNAFGFILFKAASLQPLMLSAEAAAVPWCTYAASTTSDAISVCGIQFRSNNVFPYAQLSS